VADIKDASGKSIATAELREDTGKVTIALVLASPSPLSGKHGIAITDVARCNPPDFSSAGAIFNPFGKRHGLLAQGGPMAGDLPNLGMPLERFNAPALGATLSPGPASLLAGRGTAIVVFANVDDGVSQPEGNAGARVACGVIAAPNQAVSPTATSAGLTVGPALLILALGAVLIGAGLLLRRTKS